MSLLLVGELAPNEKGPVDLELLLLSLLLLPLLVSIPEASEEYRASAMLYMSCFRHTGYQVRCLCFGQYLRKLPSLSVEQLSATPTVESASISY